jgi:hypothetical protein
VRLVEKKFKFDQEIIITITSLFTFTIFYASVFLHGDIISMINDLTIVAKSRDGHLNVVSLTKVLLETKYQVLLVVFLSILPSLFVEKHDRLKVFCRYFILGFCLIVCGLLLGATIMQSADDLIIHVPFIIIILSNILNYKVFNRLKFFVLFLIVVLSFVISASVVVKKNLNQHVKVFNSFPVKRIAHNIDHLKLLEKKHNISIDKMIDLSLYGAEKSLGEGVVLIERFTTISDSLMVVDFASPLNFITGRVSPLNTPLFWQESVTFNEEILNQSPLYAPDYLFSNVDYLLISNGKTGHASTTNMFMKNYKKTINLKFEIMATGEYWLMYRHVKVRSRF